MAKTAALPRTTICLRLYFLCQLFYFLSFAVAFLLSSLLPPLPTFSSLWSKCVPDRSEWNSIDLLTCFQTLFCWTADESWHDRWPRLLLFFLYFSPGELLLHRLLLLFFLCVSFAFLLFHCLPCSAALAPPKASVYIYFLISPPLCFAIITLFHRGALSPQTKCSSGLNIARGHYMITALQHLSCTFLFLLAPLFLTFLCNITQIIIMVKCRKPCLGVDQRVMPSITWSSWSWTWSVLWRELSLCLWAEFRHGSQWSC